MQIKKPTKRLTIQFSIQQPYKTTDLTIYTRILSVRPQLLQNSKFSLFLQKFPLAYYILARISHLSALRFSPLICCQRIPMSYVIQPSQLFVFFFFLNRIIYGDESYDDL